MERGIYGLAGFLRVSRELRILWSSRPMASKSMHQVDLIVVKHGMGNLNGEKLH